MESAYSRRAPGQRASLPVRRGYVGPAVCCRYDVRTDVRGPARRGYGRKISQALIRRIREGCSMDSSDDVISVLCQCGKKLKAPASSVGKRARCPACGTTCVIEGNKTAPSAAKQLTSIPNMAMKRASGLCMTPRNPSDAKFSSNRSKSSWIHSTI